MPTPSLEQEEIYDATGVPRLTNKKIIAFAGAGKTTTLKGIAKRRRQDRGVYVSFNRANADEARAKLAGTRCSAFSMHQLAYRAQADTIGKPKIFRANDVRESGIFSRFRIPAVKGWTDYRVSAAVIRTMSEFANSADQEFLIEHARAAIIDSVGDPEFIHDRERKEIAQDAISRFEGVLTQMAEWFWLNAAENGEMSHDMYLKMVDLDPGLRAKIFSRFDYLLGDEGQDFNPVQTSIFAKAGIPVIVVGDPYQQIYSWRGAENALDKIEGDTFYLTQSFRFAENIAGVGRMILAARPDGGPEQRLIGAGNGDISDHKGSLAAYVCRTNMGVIDDALTLMSKNKDVFVDNIDGLVSDLRSAQALYEGDMRNVKSDELKHFTCWEELETEADEGNGTMARIQRIILSNMLPRIEALKASQPKVPSRNTITLCTAHRSKGMEWPGVRLGSDWKDVETMQARYKAAEKKSAKHMTLAMEEFNAFYVAATRAKLRLQGHEKLFEKKPVDPILAASRGDVPADYRPADLSEERDGPSVRTIS